MTDKSRACPRCKSGMLKQFEEDIWSVDLRCLSCGWEYHLGRSYDTTPQEAALRASAS